jgi:hypothetical protein
MTKYFRTKNLQYSVAPGAAATFHVLFQVEEVDQTTMVAEATEAVKIATWTTGDQSIGVVAPLVLAELLPDFIVLEEPTP